ncbi:AHH domain-containing protein [Pedobacter sp. KLB.chiD]|uniref:AHH domain-containing protein n=1 Tax=Pedobacter sp. KLB.chiD TaxID=3387402 RepID=UPI0039998158
MGYSCKKTLHLANGSKTTLKWVAVAGETIHFGNRSQLRKVLQLAKGDARQAHHIIPWAKSTNWAIQKAAKSKHFFHMNDILNGIPLNNLAHSGSHNLYDNRVVELLENILKNLTPEQTYDEVLAIISHIRNTINNYPNVPFNQLLL